MNILPRCAEWGWDGLDPNPSEKFLFSEVNIFGKLGILPKLGLAPYR